MLLLMFKTFFKKIINFLNNVFESVVAYLFDYTINLNNISCVSADLHNFL